MNRSKRVVFITRQRSGGTFLLALLAQHPDVQDLGELLNFNDANSVAALARAGLSMRDVRYGLGEMQHYVWKQCTRPVCLLKVHPEHFRPPSGLEELCVPGTSALLLERTPHDEYQSWHRAVTTGVWAATPRLQQLARESGDALCPPNRCWRDEAAANAMSEARFTRQHHRWFDKARALWPSAVRVRSAEFFHAPVETVWHVLRVWGLPTLELSPARVEEAMAERMLDEELTHRHPARVPGRTRG
jgi:hypothetical protein